MRVLLTKDVDNLGRAGVERLQEAPAVVQHAQPEVRTGDAAAHRGELARLGHPEELGLGRQGQLCDLVELRSGQSGTIVRMHMRLP